MNVPNEEAQPASEKANLDESAEKQGHFAYLISSQNRK